jgi:hypothetical protein
MGRLDSLYKRRAWLKDEITANLDFIAGTVTAKGPSTFGYNLTSKVEGKTVSFYVPVALVETVREMNRRHRALRERMLELSGVNWEILKLESKHR